MLDDRFLTIVAVPNVLSAPASCRYRVSPTSLYRTSWGAVVGFAAAAMLNVVLKRIDDGPRSVEEMATASTAAAGAALGVPELARQPLHRHLCMSRCSADCVALA